MSYNKYQYSNNKSSLEDKVNEHNEILGGSLEKEGLVHVVHKIAQTIYDAETGHHRKIAELEKERTYVKAWIACAGIFCGIVVWLVQHLIKL